MKIRKQQAALCSLFSAVNIFAPEATTNELQSIITKYSIKIEAGLTIPQENMVLGELTNYELQLDPNYIDLSAKLSKERFCAIPNSTTRIPETMYFAYALIARGKHQLHRIWILYTWKSKITIIDTFYEETREVERLQDVCDLYEIFGVFNLYSVPNRGEVLLKKEKLTHLLGQ